MATLGCGPEEAHVFGRSLYWHQDTPEIQNCHVFKLDNDQPIEVDRIHVSFPTGSHHVHIYRSSQPEEESVTDCWGAAVDWSRWQLVVGAQTEAMDWRLPEGLTVPLDANQQLLVQVHWLNPTGEPMDGRIDIKFEEAEQPGAHLGVMFGIQKQVAMEPHEEKIVWDRCPAPPGANVLAIMGHFHGLGTHYGVRVINEDGREPESLYEANGEQTLVFRQYDPPHLLPEGSSLEYQCDFLNFRDIPIDWSANTQSGEHCNMVAYYFPAAEPATYCIREKAEIASFDRPPERVVAGQPIDLGLTLTEAAPAGGVDVELTAADPTAIDVPGTVHVAEGETTARFRALALRPARAARVSARLGASVHDVDVTIHGLVLSEVFLGPTAANSQAQWIEIANLSMVPIDLSHYSLGAGGPTYTITNLQLAPRVPALGCVVIGGPNRTATDQPLYDQVADFSPDLGRGGSVADGIALFDVAADQVLPTTVPLDAVVYGEDNESGLLDSSGGPATPVPPPGTGWSMVRRSIASWGNQPAGSPRICEVIP